MGDDYSTGASHSGMREDVAVYFFGIVFMIGSMVVIGRCSDDDDD